MQELVAFRDFLNDLLATDGPVLRPEEALQFWNLAQEQKLAGLRHMVQEGLDSELVGPVDIEEVIRRGHERLRSSHRSEAS